MTTVKNCLDQKPGRIISVRPDDKVVTALALMRDNRVRAMLVLDEGRLVGIVTQGAARSRCCCPAWTRRPPSSRT